MKNLISNGGAMVFAATMLASVSSTSYAEISSPVGGYFGIGVNNSDFSINKQNAVTSNQLSNQSSFEDGSGGGLDIFAGIKLDEHLAVELGYSDIGSITINDGVSQTEFLSAESLYIDTVISKDLTSNIDMFVKMGISLWELRDANDRVTEDGTGINYGAGLDVNFYGNKERVMRIQWQHQEFDGITLEGADSISASMVFNFR